MRNAILACLLLALAICGCSQEQQTSNWIEMVPSDSTMVVKFDSEMWKDQEMQDFYESYSGESWEEAKPELQEQGINPDQMERVIIWFSSVSSYGPSNFAYLIKGGFDKDALLGGDACSGGCEETEYGGYTVYSSGSDAFAFVDDYLIAGTLQAVQKTIDAKTGEDQGSREELESILGKLPDKPVKGALMVPAELKQEYLRSMEQGLTTDTGDFESVENIAFTVNKEGGNIKYTVALICTNSNTAENVKESLESVLAVVEDTVQQDQQTYESVKLFTDATSFNTEGDTVIVEASIPIHEIESKMEEAR